MINSTNKIAFIDLQAQRARIETEINNAIQRVLEHGQFIMGPEVIELEKRLADFVGANHCISLSNGTDALMLSLLALDIGPGDAVITSPFTFFATVESILSVGATPIFADIDCNSYNIAPEQVTLRIEQIQRNTDLIPKAIMPVDLFGLCADYEAINSIAREHQLFVIQDAAQSFGATLSEQTAPNHGTVGTTSFFPAKPLGCYGDGGAAFTNDDKLAEDLRSLRVHGKGVDKYDNVKVGRNNRLDTIQAAILLEKLKQYPEEIQLRQKVADEYTRLINDTNSRFEVQRFQCPQQIDGRTSVWAQYTIRLSKPLVEKRAELILRLKEQGIPSVVYYRTPSHLLGACKPLGHRVGDFPNSEQAAASVLSLPFHPFLKPETQAFIVNAIDEAADTLLQNKCC